jgi:hypothetical protein
VLQLEDCANVWWLRFALDHWCTTLAVGTNTGKVLVFDPHAPQVGCSLLMVLVLPLPGRLPV